MELQSSFQWIPQQICHALWRITITNLYNRRIRVHFLLGRHSGFAHVRKWKSVSFAQCNFRGLLSINLSHACLFKKKTLYNLYRMSLEMLALAINPRPGLPIVASRLSVNHAAESVESVTSNLFQPPPLPTQVYITPSFRASIQKLVEIGEVTDLSPFPNIVPHCFCRFGCSPASSDLFKNDVYLASMRFTHKYEQLCPENV